MGWNPFKKNDSTNEAIGQEFSIYPRVDDVTGGVSVTADRSTWLGAAPLSQPPADESDSVPAYVTAQPNSQKQPVSIPVISIDSNGQLSTPKTSSSEPVLSDQPVKPGLTLPGVSAHDVHVAGGFAALDPSSAVGKIQPR